MAYGCRIPLLRREREQHILVGAPDPSFGVGRHSHVQLGVRRTGLVVPFAVLRGLEEWCKRQPRRLSIPPVDLDVEAFPGR
jgi:hypothetical protein